MKGLQAQTRDIYNHLADEESKFIFENRMIYKLTGEKDKLENVLLYSKGLWDSEIELSFQETGSAGSKIGAGAVTISTATIDGVVGDERVSFIKMDVEGAELEALYGAEQTIRRNHPKLAICVYHKPEDIVTIPRYILSLDGDYQLYLRHYSMNQSETVIYAI